MQTRHRQTSGFTLVELILVTALVAIMTAVAIPSASQLLDHSQNRVEVNDLFGFLASARAEAVRSGYVHTLCPLDVSSSACGRDWNRPLYLFADPFNERKLTANTSVKRVLPPPERGYLLVRSLSRSYFQYRPDGQILSDLGNITWCPESGAPDDAAHLIVSRGGRIRLASDDDSDGIVEDATGNPVVCVKP
ncbi:GspH/FimT family pseudopilin [Marinobacter sp.]|uniref:GspH/FimT family pseudopilin n=1 Tax=Marinobacter sp. TaxID=50741 RepID=UPI0035684AAB